MSVIVPAGWHPDPADPTRQRWWDGKGWTDHTREAPADVAAPQGFPVPGSVPAPHPPAPPWSAGPSATTPPPVPVPGPGPGQAPWGGQPFPGQAQGPGAPQQQPYAHYGQGPLAPESRGNSALGRWWSALRYRNQMSLTTILLAAAYVAIALVAHFLLIGFLPLFYGWQAIRRREPLAPYAMVAAAIPLVLMFALYRH